MIPILYAPNTTDYRTNGIGFLSDCISCYADENMDTGEYELELTYKKGGKFFDRLKYGATIKAVPRDDEPAQLFDIYDIVDNMNGTVEVYARHVRFRLHGMPCKPFTASSLSAALAALNTFSFGGNTGFTFETNKASTTAYKLTEPLSVGETLRGVRGSILDVYGGKFAYNNFTVSLLSQRGKDRGVTIRYGKNLTDLTVETEGVAVTGILPYWYSENDGLVYADSVVTVTDEQYLPYKYHAVVDYSDDFDSKPSKAQLVAIAELDLGTGYPKASYDIQFEPLYKNQEFELLKQFEKIGMGDIVTVVHPDMGINIKARAYRIRYNVLAEKYVTISIGDYKESFASTIARIDTNSGGVSSGSSGGSGGIGEDEYLTRSVTQLSNQSISANGGKDVGFTAPSEIYETNGIQYKRMSATPINVQMSGSGSTYVIMSQIRAGGCYLRNVGSGSATITVATQYLYQRLRNQ